jgi:hypothetical protein
LKQFGEYCRVIKLKSILLILEEYINLYFLHNMAKQGLYANIHAKRARIAAGSGEKMRKVGAKGAPTSKQFKQAAKTAKKK